MLNNILGVPRGPGRPPRPPIERQRKQGVGSVSLPQRRKEKAALLILGPRNWGPRKSPAKRVLWGEDEQGSGRNFRRQAEMKWSGLCEDEGGPGVRTLRTKARPWRLQSAAAVPRRIFGSFLCAQKGTRRKARPRRSWRPGGASSGRKGPALAKKGPRLAPGAQTITG